MRTQAITLGFLSYAAVMSYFWIAGLLAFTGTAYLPGYEVAASSLNRVFLSGLNILVMAGLSIMVTLGRRHQRMVRMNQPPRTVFQVLQELKSAGEREALADGSRRDAQRP